MNIITYIFWPNPGNATYQSPKVVALLVICLLFVLASVIVRIWRRRLTNPVTRKLSKSWPTATLWFGVVGLFLVVSRVEQISFVSMRFLWLIWAGLLVFYLFMQYKLFRAKHYEELPKVKVDDPREQYLPKKKKRK